MTKQILVVDDDTNVRDFFEAALKRAKHTVYTASSAQDALQLMQEVDFDVVLSDVKMPNLSGIDLLKLIMEQSRDVVVIMVTAFGTVKNAVEAMKLGAYDYILKPIMPDELDLVINKALEYRQLLLENRILKSEIRKKYKFENIVGEEKNLVDLLQTLESAAMSRSTIMIQGESGTGKELLARAIHYNSPRADGPFIKLNCAALPEGLMESELFGHEKGAFTGAIKQSSGRFELADGGTLLLDEVSEVPISLQAKLLRVIQEREFERVGSGVTTKVDVRIVATTNRNLQEEIKAGNFREDLFYRLNVIPLDVPPLRERKSDLPLLIDFFIEKYNEENGKMVEGITDKAVKLIHAYHWPGNIRELENYIERAVVLCNSDRITENDLPGYLVLGELANSTNMTIQGGMSLSEIEKIAIVNALEKHNGNRTKASEELAISSRTLRNKLHEYGMMNSDN